MTKNSLRVLSLDGGGIRGIIPATILAYLEEKTGRPICDLFDLIAGTSTGGIIACGLVAPDPNNPGKPKFSARQLLELYTTKGSEIFQKHFGAGFGGALFNETFSQAGLEKLLKEYFGDSELKDALKPVVVTSYDIEKRMPNFFMSRAALENPQQYNFLFRDITRSTSAAPTYFEPNLMHSADGERLALVDGGVCANNPSTVAFAEASEMLRRKRNEAAQKAAAEKELESFPAPTPEFSEDSAPEIFMLSIGTGTGLKPYSYEDAKGWGMVGWVKPIIDIIMQGTAEVSHYHMEYVLPPSPSGRHYVRINPNIDIRYNEMSDTSPENIKGLQAIGGQAIIDGAADLAEVLKVLTQ